jgi:hypothetical protein
MSARWYKTEIRVEISGPAPETADPGNLTFAGGRRDARAPEGF